MKKSTVSNKVVSKFFRDGKDNMTMSTINKFRGDGVSSILNILRPTRITESTFAGIENMFNITTVVARINGMTHGRFTTSDDFINIVQNSRTNGISISNKGIPMVQEDIFNINRRFRHNITIIFITKKEKRKQEKKES